MSLKKGCILNKIIRGISCLNRLTVPHAGLNKRCDRQICIETRKYTRCVGPPRKAMPWMILKTTFRAIIGMLSYIAGHTKPDIAYALNVLSRYCNNPGRRHLVFLNHLVNIANIPRMIV